MAFNQHTTPTAMEQLILRAKNESPIKTFSRSFSADPAKVATVTGLFRANELPAVRMGSLLNPELVTQFLFVMAGQIFPITHPCVVNEPGQGAVYVGNMSDELDECIPIAVPAAGFSGWFTSLLPRDIVDSYHLPTFFGVAGHHRRQAISSGSTRRRGWLLGLTQLRSGRERVGSHDHGRANGSPTPGRRPGPFGHVGGR